MTSLIVTSDRAREDAAGACAWIGASSRPSTRALTIASRADLGFIARSTAIMTVASISSRNVRAKYVLTAQSVLPTVAACAFCRENSRFLYSTNTRKTMRAIIVGAGMGGLFSALSLRESGAFRSVDVYEQTKTPSTAGAGLNIAPNGARLCKWLGVDLDGGDPKGPHGAVDGGRA